MELSFGSGHSFRFEHRLRLTGLRFYFRFQRDLAETIHGGTFKPEGICPQCHYELKDYEIMRGFLDDPTDYTTECPKCEFRFPPRLHRSSEHGGYVETAFFCPEQTLDQLAELVDVPLEEFRIRHAAVYNSAIIHFGGLKQAFKRIDLTYAYEQDLDWRNKIMFVLGKMPDTVIARFVGVSVRSVRALRKRSGIERFRIQKEASASV